MQPFTPQAAGPVLAPLSIPESSPPTFQPATPALPPPSPLPSQPPVSLTQLRATNWSALPDWEQDALIECWPAFLQSCVVLKNQPAWQAVCTEAANLVNPDNATIRTFFEQRFRPYQVFSPDNTITGMITGYYEPLIKGDRVRTAKARYPLYATPDDLVVVDLASVYPELKAMRLRGRLRGNRLIPYYTRAEIEREGFHATPIAWAEDALALFFLQIQGSGRIELPDGTYMRVGYAEQNGHPYRSIGKILVERGELKPEQSSMQGIKAWAAANPDKLPELLLSNPSYVFFRELPNNLSAPLGTLGVPLTAGRSIAVDPQFIPLGAPVFLSTTFPASDKPLNRLVMAQDTGGTINGAVRADFFWGFGDKAGELAGKMKQKGKMWVLLPRGYPIVQAQH